MVFGFLLKIYVVKYYLSFVSYILIWAYITIRAFRVNELGLPYLYFYFSFLTLKLTTALNKLTDSIALSAAKIYLYFQEKGSF